MYKNSLAFYYGTLKPKCEKLIQLNLYELNNMLYSFFQYVDSDLNEELNIDEVYAAIDYKFTMQMFNIAPEYDKAYMVNEFIEPPVLRRYIDNIREVLGNEQFGPSNGILIPENLQLIKQVEMDFSTLANIMRSEVKERVKLVLENSATKKDRFPSGKVETNNGVDIAYKMDREQKRLPN